MDMLKTLIPFFSLALIAQTPAPTLPQPAVPKVHPPVAGAAAEATEPKDGDVIATLGKRTILYGDFGHWLKLMAGPRADMIRKNPANRNQVLKQYLELQVLAAKGRQENLQNTKEFKATLSALEQQCYARTLMDEDRPGSEGQKLKAKAENPTDAEVLAYFKANSERYATPEKFTARHLLVALKGAPGAGDKGLTEAEAQAKLAKLQDELKAGKKLADLTKDNSDDPGSKNNGGLYSDIPFGRFAKEFEAAVRTQEIGQVGPPVKTAFGYHLIEVESRSPKQAADFDKVKDAVRKQMIPERREQLTKEFMEQAKKEVGFKEVAESKAAGATPAPQAP
jgi:parvulin-like peptidyl-prolyl isomerase